MEKVAVAFSGGKDSTLLVHRLLGDRRYRIDSLFVTVTRDRKSTSHKVNVEIIKLQADALGLSLDIIDLSEFTEYNFESAMSDYMAVLKKRGVKKIAYGDLYLEEVRMYKEDLFADQGIELIVPLWKENTRELIKKFLGFYYSAYIICVDTKQLDLSFLGEKLTHELLDRFPIEVDPCGENGEFHTVVCDGPIFKKPINVQLSKMNYHVNQRWYYKEVILV